MLITFTGGRCSGWLYGNDIVATAGHCVHDGGPGGNWKQNVQVFPGRNGNSSPYGSCTARRLHSVNGWVNSSNEEYDYGAIKLNCSIGNTTGWFGYWWQSASLNNGGSIINGYPGDKPLTQWKSADSVRVSSERAGVLSKRYTGRDEWEWSTPRPSCRQPILCRVMYHGCPCLRIAWIISTPREQSWDETHKTEV